MKKYLRKLESILQIPEKPRRLEELRAFIRRIGNGSSELPLRSGEGSEERLVLAVYDQIRMRHRKQEENLRLIILAAGILALIAAVIALVPSRMLETLRNAQINTSTGVLRHERE